MMANMWADRGELHTNARARWRAGSCLYHFLGLAFSLPSPLALRYFVSAALYCVRISSTTPVSDNSLLHLLHCSVLFEPLRRSSASIVLLFPLSCTLPFLFSYFSNYPDEHFLSLSRVLNQFLVHCFIYIIHVQYSFHYSHISFISLPVSCFYSLDSPFQQFLFSVSLLFVLSL